MLYFSPSPQPLVYESNEQVVSLVYALYNDAVSSSDYAA
jgi:hypothetical protein